MTRVYHDVYELPKESFFIQFEDNLKDLSIELKNYMKVNRSHFSRNQYTDAKRILSHIALATAISEAILDSILPVGPVDGIDNHEEDIPF